MLLGQLRKKELQTEVQRLTTGNSRKLLKQLMLLWKCLMPEIHLVQDAKAYYREFKKVIE